LLYLGRTTGDLVLARTSRLLTWRAVQARFPFRAQERASVSGRAPDRVGLWRRIVWAMLDNLLKTRSSTRLAGAHEVTVRGGRGGGCGPAANRRR
jgi:hypothetical protein